jgi:hypothetical protein
MTQGCAMLRDRLMTGLVKVPFFLLVLALVPVAVVQADVCPEPNGEDSTACYLPDGAAVHGTIESKGDIDAYKIELPSAGTLLRLDLTDLPADYDLFLGDENNSILGRSEREGPVPEALELTIQAAGTYFAYIWGNPSRAVDPSRPYTLRLTLAASAEAPTRADQPQPEPTPMPDPGPAAASAALNCPEPNDKVGNACLLPDGGEVREFINQPGDIDTYRLEVPAPGTRVRVELTDLPADYDLYLAAEDLQLHGRSVQEGLPRRSSRRPSRRPVGTTCWW